MTGRALPASVVSRVGSIVVVKFEITGTFTLPNVRVPMVGAEYLRLPIQPGCKGWVIPADAYLGGMSGLGGGVADLVPRGNLSSLVWSPIGNTSWTAAENANAAILYGPDGCILRDTASTAVVTISPGHIVLAVGAINITITAAGIVVNGPITFNGIGTGPGGVVDFGSSTLRTTGPAQVGSVVSGGDVTAGGISSEHHTHSGVTPGGGASGPPVP